VRVISLLPAATEIVAALGEAGTLVGISHECDYPSSIRRLPRLTSTPIQIDAPSRSIDSEVRLLGRNAQPVITIDEDLVRRLAPDLILTQDLCQVCAVGAGQVHRLASVLDPAPRVLSLTATDLPGIWRDILRIGAALGVDNEAEELVRDLQRRLQGLADSGPAVAPRVVCIEWLDPLYLAGHWVPDLVAAAGGTDVGAESGSPSRRAEWSELIGVKPTCVVIMLCGFGVERSREELERLAQPEGFELMTRVPTWVLDGNAYTSRPGPRVVDGAAHLQSAFRGNPLPGIARWQPAGVCSA
jgi:iron complex transport system substrate-binding protein